jgi:hypothetical protein
VYFDRLFKPYKCARVRRRVFAVDNADSAQVVMWGAAPSGAAGVSADRASFVAPTAIDVARDETALLVADAGAFELVRVDVVQNCLPGFYGRQCLLCDCSINAICNDTINGDGSCTCIEVLLFILH